VDFDQAHVNINRHAIECRINAEDAANNFMPSPGRINAWQPPRGAGIRIDSHCRDGYLVPPFYDSMIGKLIVTANDRDAAVERMSAALESFQIHGITTNLPMLRHIVQHPDFKANRISTRWLEQHVLADFQN
jgi:acetyl-CoA carboxylase biotin carboxylase subunit